MFKKEKIKDKKGLSIISTIVAMVIFSTLISGFTAWFISLNNNVNLTGDRLAEMSIVYDKWNLINSEDFDALEARIDGLSSRTETKTVSSIYNLSVVYGTEGKFINGECVSGTATDEEQRCLPVAISVTNTTLPLNKPYALATTRVASKGSSGSSGGEFTDPGWTQLANGTIIQWGTFRGGSVVFPKEFPHACLSVTANMTGYFGAYGNKSPYVARVDSYNTTGAYIQTSSLADEMANAWYATSAVGHYMAIGY